MQLKYIKSRVYLFKWLIVKENMVGENWLYTSQVRIDSIKLNILHSTYVYM